MNKFQKGELPRNEGNEGNESRRQLWAFQETAVATLSQVLKGRGESEVGPKKHMKVWKQGEKKGY